MMGKVSEHLTQLLERQLRKKGLVVWYDPSGAYTEFFEQLPIDNAEKLAFSVSLFRLRLQLEPYLEFVSEDGKPLDHCGVPPRLIVYVSQDRSTTKHALIEAEAAGTVVEPGAAALDRNSRLSVLAEQVFRELAPEKAPHIARQAEEGLLTLADLDRLAEDVHRIGSGPLRLIFGHVSPIEAALLFLSSNRFDAQIEQKKALDEITDLFRSEFGIGCAGKNPASALRAEGRRRLLALDFLLSLPADRRPAKMASLSLPASEVHVDSIRHACDVWRNRLDLRKGYQEAADEVERSLGIQSLELAPEDLREVKTFRGVERRLLVMMESAVASTDFGRPLELARERKASYWALEDPALSLRWSLVELGAEVRESAAEMRNDLKAAAADSPEDLIKGYLHFTRPWMLVDRFHRHFETHLSGLEFESAGAGDALEKMVARVRGEYSDAVRLGIEAFTEALQHSGFQINDFMRQPELFSGHVAGLCDKGGKVAYFLVDSLRFEMAAEFFDGLSGEFDGALSPAIAQLPTITPIGMAALLPGAERGMELVENGDKAVVVVTSEMLKNREERMNFLRRWAGVHCLVLKLNDLMKPSKRRQQEIKAASFVVVTSQEIDRLGEEVADEDEVRQYMEGVLEKLRRGVRTLSALGFGEFVITADHGHIFAEAIDSGMKIDSPGGKTLEMHRRVWIGRGGTAAEGYVRVHASDLGLGGELEFAFPRSLACFKARAHSTAYVHGGISLQEMVVPVCVLRASERRPASARFSVSLDMAKDKITNRFFSVTASLKGDGLFEPGEIRIRMELFAGEEQAGFAATAAYGFEDGTREIILKPGRPNVITLMLGTGDHPNISIRALDAVSQVELASLKGVPVDLAI